MRLIFILTILLLLTACSGDEAPPAPTPVAAAPVPTPPVVPESDLYTLAVGGNGFRADMDLTALQNRYGADKVSLQDVPLGEGESESGAVIHADDPSRRAYVYFVDGNTKSSISAIYIRDGQSIWVGPMGLKLGMTSLELERLNGKPFRFLGFEWDYGGYVSNWTEGTLASAFLAPGQLSLRLAPPELADGAARADGYPMGESEFASDIPPVREQPPVVIEMGLGFVPAAAEGAAAAPVEPTD